MNLANREKWIITASVSFGALMATIDTFILYVAMPKLMGYFSASLSEIVWINISFAIGALIVMPLSGKLADRYGMKTVYKLALLVFCATAIMNSMSENLVVLSLFRLIQGFAAGVLIPVEQLILRRTFHPSEHRLVMGVYGATVMIGPAIGPVVGGYIIDNFTWHWIFLVNLPIGIIGYIAVDMFVKKDIVTEKIKEKTDLLGVVLLGLFVTSLVVLLERGERTYWSEDNFNIFLFCLISYSFLMFVVHSIIDKNAVVNLRVIKNPIFCTSVIFNFVLGVVVSGTLFLLPLFMQAVLGFTATQSGEALIPRALVMILVFPLTGIMLKNIKAKYITLVGLMLGILSAYQMSKFTHYSGSHDIIFPSILQGISVAFVLTSIGSVAYKTLKQSEMSAAAGVDAVARQLGTTIGVALFASVMYFFQLSIWNQVRGTVTLHNPVFFERFLWVKSNFYTRTISDSTVATDRAFMALNGRLIEQVNIVSYMKIFEWITLAFVALSVIALFVKYEDKKNE